MKRIVHLGIGNFHRAHQAWYTQKANIAENDDWVITGVSLRSPTVRDQLARQAFSYTLAIKDKTTNSFEKINVHDQILVGSENTADIVDCIADPATHCVTITISEKGYHLDHTGARLDLESEPVKNDIDNPMPTTAVGILARGLDKRAKTHNQPINIISCDNLAGNGGLLKNAIATFCAVSKISCENYLANRVSFPNTMVDRIVPATTDALRQEVKTETGHDDLLPVSTEMFSEWYVEDSLVAPAPAWQRAGTRFVENVEPFELRKLRLLNGSHSYLAYGGLLAGYEYVHEAIADEHLRAMVNAYWLEAMATLPQQSAQDADRYCNALTERFENPNLNHRLRQIAMDGSLKLPVRVLPVIKDRKKKGLESPVSTMILETWAQFVVDQLTNGIVLEDPHNASILSVCQQQNDKDKQILALIRSLEK